jgi:hypothetical protein
MSARQTVTGSDAFRRFMKQGPGRAVVRSAAFESLMIRRNAYRSRSAARRDPERFAHVRTFCAFVGHNKSGTSLMGSLLDAHPDVVLSDEVDALRYVEAGFGREQLYHLLLRASELEASKGRVTARRLQPYSYAVPGGYQGVSATPLVVGDSTSGSTTRRLGADPGLLDRLEALVRPAEVRLVQVVRNPFDPISVMMVRGNRSFENSIEHYFRACEALERIRDRCGPDRLRTVRYEEVVRGPERRLDAVCRFLGVDPDPSYLRDCAAIVRPEPDRSRGMVEWTPTWVRSVEERMARFDFLEGYRYEP